MGLAMALRLGEDFYADDERFMVTEILNATAFTIQRERDGVKFEFIDDGSSHEIAPQVMASVNLRGQGNLARFDLSAPRSVNLATGKNYRNAQISN